MGKSACFAASQTCEERHSLKILYGIKKVMFSPNWALLMHTGRAQMGVTG
jgi:hypothetical protein